MPFPGTGLPARAYFAYVPQGPPNPAGDTFCEWLGTISEMPIIS